MPQAEALSKNGPRPPSPEEGAGRTVRRQAVCKQRNPAPRGSTCKQETSGNSVELDQLERHHHPFERIEVVPLSNCESSVVLSDEEGAEEFTQSAWMTVYRK